MTISETLLPEFEEEMKNTRRLLECVPDDKFDYKPHEKSMTLGRLAAHVAEMPAWASTTLDVEVLTLDGMNPNVATSRAGLLSNFDAALTDARAKIAAADDAAWAVLWTLRFKGKDIMSMPRAVVMRSVVMNHMIHHRAQLGVYLRLNEVEIPGMYGPSADEAKFWQG